MNESIKKLSKTISFIECQISYIFYIYRTVDNALYIVPRVFNKFINSEKYFLLSLYKIIQIIFYILYNFYVL